MANLTAAAKTLAKMHHNAKRNPAHIIDILSEPKKITCWDKILGEHTIIGSEIIGKKNLKTGEITML